MQESEPMKGYSLLPDEYLESKGRQI
jgi:hypothetical protein